jgi:hypothetical protein
MKNDLLAIGGPALATLLVTLVVAWPYQVSALGPGESKKPLVTPVLKAQGCELTLKATSATWKAGDTPTVELKAANPGNAKANITASLSMMVTPPVNMMSRALPMAREFWKGECPLLVNAHKSLTVALTPKAKLAPGSTGYFVLKVGDISTIAAQFAVEALPVKAGALPIEAANLKPVTRNNISVE